MCCDVTNGLRGVLGRDQQPTRVGNATQIHNHPRDVWKAFVFPWVDYEFGVLRKAWHGLCVTLIERSKMLEPNPKALADLNFRRPAMQTLLIKELSLNEELDSRAMAALQGGRMKIPGQRFSFGQQIAVPSLGGELLDDTSDSSDDRLNPAGI